MTFLEMKNEVKAYTGEQNAARIGAAINTVYRDLRNILKWPQLLIQVATPITLVDGTQTYDLSSDFRWPYRFWVVDPNNGEAIYIRPYQSVMNTKNDGTVLRYRLKRGSAGTAATRPAWVIALENIPNGTFVAQYASMYYEYYYQAPDLSGDTDLTKFDADDDSVIVLNASILLVAKQDDQAAFTMLATMAAEARANMIQRAIEQYGEGIIVKPGDEITETETQRIDDYGRTMI